MNALVYHDIKFFPHNSLNGLENLYMYYVHVRTYDYVYTWLLDFCFSNSFILRVSEWNKKEQQIMETQKFVLFICTK